MFVLNVSLVTMVLLWSVYRWRLIHICLDRFTNCITFWSSFSTWIWLSLLEVGTFWNRRSLRKHPFLLALRRWARLAGGEERGETDVFAGWNRRRLWLLPTSEFLFWFKVESRGFSCHAFIGFLMGLFIPLWLSTGNSFKSLGKAFVMVSKPKRTYVLLI